MHEMCVGDAIVLRLCSNQPKFEFVPRSLTSAEGCFFTRMSVSLSMKVVKATAATTETQFEVEILAFA